MLYVLYILFFLSCIVLVASVLLQPGKTDAGALFTSNVSSNAFGPRGTATVLSKITIAAAIVFMLSALMISMPAFTGQSSVLSTTGEIEESAPVTDANTDPANDNTNGALIETPATEQFSEQAANAASAQTNSSTSNANSSNANTAKPSPRR